MAAYYTFEDLSGSTSTGTQTDNPYHDLIESCNNDPTQIQQRYSTHRTNRNIQQKAKLLAPDFPGVTPDEILANLETTPDWRHCLVFWARPTAAVRQLILSVQMRLKDVVPGLWLMPPSSLHMTALEITHSLTAPEIDALVSQLLPYAEEIVNFTRSHRARLVKPCISFDAQALALSFLPAAGETSQAATEESEGDGYTYHHLRRDLFSLASKSGVKVASRYVIPSAHLTIGRFIRTKDFEGEDGKLDRGKVAELVRVIEEINKELEEKYADFEWIVGQEKGLEFRKGTLWYGSGGETVMVGEGS